MGERATAVHPSWVARFLIYVCESVCVYTYTYINWRARATAVHPSWFVRSRMYVCMYKYVYMYMRAGVDMYVCMYVYTCVCRCVYRYI